MKLEEIMERLKEMAEEWESFECSPLSAETEDWCTATEEATWLCAGKLQDLILEIEEE
jgi:hypothetical protein